MNCLMKLPWSAGVYKENKRYYPQDRVLCDGSVYVSLAEQMGNRPSFTVTPDGMYEVSAGWGLLAPGLAGSSDGMDYSGLLNKPRINGVELIGNKTAEELGLATAEDIPDTSGLVKSEDLSKVATSGDYSDLSNKPAIPTAVTEQTVEGWGFTKNAGDYSKPTGGIPKSDLDTSVQTSLGKADTALQSESDPTVPDWAKQSTKPTYTAAEVGALPSTTKIPSKTSDLTNDGGYLTEGRLKTVNGQSLVGEGDVRIEGGGSSVTVDPELSDTSENPVQNKVVKEALDSKQDKGDYALKSDIPDVTDLAKKTDIPDVTGLATKSEVSLVEEQTAANAAGILEKVDKVEGKQLSTNDYTDSDKAKVAAALTEHQSLAGYAKTAEVGTMISEAIAAIPPSGREVVKTNADTIGFGTSYAADTPSVELAADKFHIVGRVSRLALTLPDGAATDGKEYICQFFVGENSASYTLTLPDTVVWLGGDAPVMESEACYMLSIVNHCAVCGVFKQSA